MAGVTRRATGRFLFGVQTAPIDNLKRNRMIDHAAALLLGSHGDLGRPSATRAPTRRYIPPAWL